MENKDKKSLEISRKIIVKCLEMCNSWVISKKVIEGKQSRQEKERMISIGINTYGTLVYVAQ